MSGATPAARAVMSETAPTLPAWWNDRIDAAWSRSREAAISDWNVRGDRSCSNPSILERALAFGHGARSAYSQLLTWDAVAPHLCADWTALGTAGPASWEMVVYIIQHEWRRAAGPGGDAEPESTARDSSR